MSVKSYRDLPLYQLSFPLAVEVDEMTRRLPKYEFYEKGQQVRRSAKSIPANLAEGYGRRRYRNDYIKFIVYALASCDETRVHLDCCTRQARCPKTNTITLQSNIPSWASN